MPEHKPRIIVLSSDTDDRFIWQSVGWNQIKWRHTEEAKRLMKAAHEAIDAADDVPDAIRRLEEAGFEVRRD